MQRMNDYGAAWISTLKEMRRASDEEYAARRYCPRCKGAGVEPGLPRSFALDCKRCHGEGTR